MLPDEVQVQPAPDAPARPARPAGVADREIAPPAGALADGASRCSAGARRPVIVVGHGARFDMADVLALAEALDAPVLTTFKAKGLVSDHHPLGCGVLGRSGTPVASWLMNESDLLVVFGASFSNHTGIAAYKPIVQVDFDPMALGRFHPVTVPVLGRRRRHRPRCSPSGSPPAADRGRPAGRRRRALGDLAGREGAPPRRRPRPRRRLGRGVRRA